MKITRWLLLVALAATLLAPTVAHAQDGAPATSLRRVGVVFDGPAPRMAEVWKQVEREITVLIGSEFDLQFPAAKQLTGDWKSATAKRLTSQLLDDPNIEVVITFGVIASNEAVKRRSLPKPTVAPFVLNPALQGLLGKTGKRRRVQNLSYLVWSLDLKRDLKVFRELGEFDKIALLSNAHIQREIPELRGATAEAAKKIGIELSFVPVEQDVAAASAKIPANVDGVYVGPNLQLTLEQIEQLSQRLIDRKLPSFSWIGRAEVDRGLLMGLGAPADTERLARRLALNVQSIFLGDEPSSMITAFKLEERLVLNMATARAIKLSPSWTLLTEADMIKKQRSNVKRALSLSKVVAEAQKSNIDLRAFKSGVLAGEEDIDAARSALLPRLEASLTGVMIDADRAGFGNAERTLQWSASLTQVIYSERAWAGLDIANIVQKSRTQDEVAVKLDVMHAAAIAYLNVLRAKTAERIQRENLKLTRENLALARVRQRIGTGRPSEVLRWESSIASVRRELIQLVAQRNLTEMELNRLLGRPIEENFSTAEPRLDDTVLMSGEPRFRKMLANPQRFRLAREFLVAEGLRAAPELKSLNALQAAKQREVRSNTLAPFVPTFALQASLTHNFLTSGAGTDDISAGLPPGVDIPLPDPDPFNWQIGLSMTLPIYQGGERYARTRKSEKEHEQLVLQEKSTRDRIDQRVRAALHRAGASLPGIRLAREAARAARETRELSTMAYSQGAASILELLDAQNQALIADLSATTATYDFLIDLMNVERAIGRFDFSRSADNMAAFMSRMEAYVQKGEAR